MRETLHTFLDSYDKMLRQSKLIIELVAEKKHINIPADAVAYTLSFDESVKNVVTIQWHEPESGAYGDLIVPLDEYCKRIEDMDVSTFGE